MHARTYRGTRPSSLASNRVEYGLGNLRQSPQVQNMLRSHRMQAKLTVGAPNDRYEQEADRVADQMMRMPEPQVQRQAELDDDDEELIRTKPLSAQVTPLAQRQVNGDQEESDEEQFLQGKPFEGQSIAMAPVVAGNINGAPRQLQRN